MNQLTESINANDIAIVGMACRFPSANNIHEFWQNLLQGKNAIRFFSHQELLSQPGFNKNLLADPNFIPAKGYLEDADKFAADFFNFSAKTANITDPQFRLFLECIWHAWEDFAQDPYTTNNKVGVYATSSSKNSYYQANLYNNAKYNMEATAYEQFVRNSRDFMATLAAYHYNFQGPCINVQTACSSSLVAVCYACDDLRRAACDIAVVGAASISFPLKAGYIYKQGMIYSKDGYCRPFAADASGIVSGDGVGVVILKLLKNAIANNDPIYAVIKGYAVNNDGKVKLSFTAPSYDGQLSVLRLAASDASVKPCNINYIEAHGTGTKLGDQIEVAALKAFLTTGLLQTTKCYLGSVKSNIGHLDVASGIAGLIKTALALKHQTIPKTLFCNHPNPDLELHDSPLAIADKTIAYPNDHEHLHLAGVSSFGIGGTNTHIILQKWPQKPRPKKGDNQQQAILLSAKSATELEQKRDQLAAYLRDNIHINLDDIACTSQVGRAHLPHRLAINAIDIEELIENLYLPVNSNIFQHKRLANNTKVAFLCGDTTTTNRSFSPNFFSSHREIQSIIQDCFATAKSDKELYSDLTNLAEIKAYLHSFLQQYFLLRYWEILGVTPDVIVGFEVGEYVAACYAGIFSFTDALKLLRLRAKILDSSPVQARLLVIATPTALAKHIDSHKMQVHIIETPNRCVLYGEKSQIANLNTKLLAENVTTHLLTEAAIISSKDLQNKTFDIINSINFTKPRIEIIPSTIANQETNQNMASPLYWQNRLGATINIAQSSTSLLNTGAAIFLEISDQLYLGSLLQQTNYQLPNKKEIIVLPHACDLGKKLIPSITATTFTALWSAGVNINWHFYRNFYQLSGERITLPLYPFTRHTYLAENTNASLYSNLEDNNTSSRKVETFSTDPKILSYLYQPIWHKQNIIRPPKPIYTNRIVFVGEKYANSQLITCFKKNYPAMDFSILSDESFYSVTITEEVLINRVNHWLAVITQSPKDSAITIIYTWPCHDILFQNGTNTLNCFYDLIALSKAVGKLKAKYNLRLLIVATNAIVIKDEIITYPQKSMLLSLVLCLPVEYKNIETRFLDFDSQINTPQSIKHIADELLATETRPLIAYRNGSRLARFFEPKPITKQSSALTWRENGVYLITGGLGGIGLTIAQHLADNYRAHLVLVSRTKLPEESQWAATITAKNTDDTLIKKLQILLKIKVKAKSLSVYSADVADANMMGNIIINTEKQVGSVSAVIHAAAQFPKGLLQQKKLINFQQMFASKITGTEVLANLFAAKSLDFMLLFSSLSSIRGTAGAVDYIAANIYLDTFALANQHRVPYPILSIGWDGWQEIGMRFEYFTHRNNNEKIIPLNSPEWCSLLQEHKLEGKILLPGSAIINLIVKYLLQQDLSLPLSFSNIAFLRPGFINTFSTGTHRICRATTTLELQQIYDGNWTPLARANFIESTNNSCIQPPAQKILERFATVPCLSNIERQTKHLDLGPHWNCLSWVKQQKSTYLAKLELPSKYCHELQEYFLHPALLDVGISFCSRFLLEQYLPFYIQGLTVCSRLPNIFYSFVEILSINDTAGTCVCKVLLFDEQYKTLLTIDNFVLKLIKQFQNDLVQTKVNPTSSRYGLTNSEGLAALEHILNNPATHIIVSKTNDLEKTQKLPLLPNEIPTAISYSAKTSTLIDQVRHIWQITLEYKDIKDHDDFFKIGGDSLSAIEVCYRIKSDLGIDVAPHTLLEDSTLTSFVNAITLIA